MPSSELVGNNERTKVFYPISGSKSFDYKTNLVGSLPDGENELDNLKIAFPLKNLSNFIFNLNFLTVNTEIELILKWGLNCVLTEKAERERKEKTQNPQRDAAPAINIPSDLKFNITVNCMIL